MFNLIPSWFGFRRSKKRSKQQVQTAPHGGFRRLRHEQLEDRRMLAVLTVSTNADSSAFPINNGILELREAIAYVNQTAFAGNLDAAQIDETADALGTNDKIIFDSALNGSTITLTQDELKITKSVVISGGFQNTSGGGLPNITPNITIDASGNDQSAALGNGSRVFNIQLTPTAGETQAITFDSLTITGGVYALAA